MSRIFLTSDMHFNHLLMAKLRGFKSIDDMNTYIVRQWNKTVNNDDVVYILGDVYWKDGDIYKEYIEPHLNGNLIYIRGNHDKKSLTDNLGMVIDYKNKTLSLTHKPEEALGGYINLHGHTHIHSGEAHINYDYENKEVYYNVNVEFHKYKPKLLNEIIGEVKIYKQILRNKNEL